MSNSNNDFNEFHDDEERDDAQREDAPGEEEAMKQNDAPSHDDLDYMEHDNGSSVNLGAKGPKLRNPQDEIDKLKEMVADLKQQINDMETRHVADIQNLVRRHQGEIKTKRENAVADFAIDFLGITDVFEMALNDKTEDYRTLRMGLEMIYKNMMDVFASKKIKVVPAKVGDKLDIKYHAAARGEVCEDCDPGIILSVLKKGYMMGDRVIRHTSVIVSQRSEESQAQEQAPVNEDPMIDEDYDDVEEIDDSKYYQAEEAAQNEANEGGEAAADEFQDDEYDEGEDFDEGHEEEGPHPDDKREGEGGEGGEGRERG